MASMVAKDRKKSGHPDLVASQNRRAMKSPGYQTAPDKSGLIAHLTRLSGCCSVARRIHRRAVVG
jgi:hypothetical protein